MAQKKKEKNPPGGGKMAIIGGAATLAVIAIVCFLVFSGGSGQGDRPDPNAEVRAATKQLSGQIKDLMASGQFDPAAKAIGEFLKKYPSAPQAAQLLALKSVCHRKDDNISGALLSIGSLAEKFQGSGEDLCKAGDVLQAHECFQDAAKAFELAADYESVRFHACLQAAICNYRLGRFAAAMKFIDVVAALKPDDPKVLAAVKRIEDARFVMDR
jgi:tetratricopeptide (TPR) repeat protein